jgi:hypothetical protein
MSPHLISASRRTDIPQFYGAWFAARRKAGFCESRNVFGGGYRISLRPEDVAGYLFWTKNSAPFEDQLAELLGEGVPVAIQFTLNGYGPSVEANIPGPDVTIPAFLRASGMLPSPSAIQWRYDPVVVTGMFTADWHKSNFRRIASRLQGATRICNTSVVEPYLRVVRRMGEEVAYRCVDPGRHRQVARQYPALRQAGEAEAGLIEDLSRIAREYGIALRACCNPELKLPAAACCGAELFDGYGIGERLAAAGPGPSRTGCRCLKTLDIGMDNTCPGGCAYCYVTTSARAVVRNAAGHAASSPRMR